MTPEDVKLLPLNVTLDKVPIAPVRVAEHRTDKGSSHIELGQGIRISIEGGG